MSSAARRSSWALSARRSALGAAGDPATEVSHWQGTDHTQIRGAGCGGGHPASLEETGFAMPSTTVGHSMEAPAGAEFDVGVFGPSLFTTVTIEPAGDGAAVHFHPGGQAFWIARMLSHLGLRCALVSPVGGEPGVVLSALTPTWDVDLIAVPTTADSPAYVHDRRNGARREVATSPGGTLSRHEVDDLYGRILEVAAAARWCVVTGSMSGRALGDDFYRRLGNDLSALGVDVVGDLHGPELDAYLDGGSMKVLKVSHEDLIEDGRLPAEHDMSDRVRIATELHERGARMVVVSAPTAAILIDRDDVWHAKPPQLDPVDSRGAGDAMTAALCVAARRGDDVARMLRFACAAGAATVARRGLANADPDVIDALTEAVEVDSAGRAPVSGRNQPPER